MAGITYNLEGNQMDEIPMGKIISFILTKWNALEVVFPFEFCQTESSENVHHILVIAVRFSCSNDKRQLSFEHMQSTF